MQEMQKQILEFGSQLVRQLHDAQSMQQKHDTELLELKRSFSQQMALKNEPHHQPEQQAPSQPLQGMLALGNDTEAAIEQKADDKATGPTKPKAMEQVTSDLVAMLAGGKASSTARAEHRKNTKEKTKPTAKAKPVVMKKPVAANAEPVAMKKPAAKISSAKKGGSYKHHMVLNRAVGIPPMKQSIPGGRHTANGTKHTPC